MSSSENKSDKKLEAFLKENRPLYPRHSEREAEKIWARLSANAEETKRERAWGLRPQIFGGAFAAVAVIVFVTSLTSHLPVTSSVTTQKPPVAIHQESAAEKNPDAKTTMMTSEDLIEDSLELGFLENEEMYEVTDLISLGK